MLFAASSSIVWLVISRAVVGFSNSLWVPASRAIVISISEHDVAKRLVEAQQTMAILTTFNEIDMGAEPGPGDLASDLAASDASAGAVKSTVAAESSSMYCNRAVG